MKNEPVSTLIKTLVDGRLSSDARTDEELQSSQFGGGTPKVCWATMTVTATPA
jgi:hypothetical protein